MIPRHVTIHHATIHRRAMIHPRNGRNRLNVEIRDHAVSNDQWRRYKRAKALQKSWGTVEGSIRIPCYSYRFSDDAPLDVAADSRGVVFFPLRRLNDTLMLIIYDDKLCE